MALLPFDRLVIDSPLSPEEAVARLAANVEPARWLRFGGGAREFEGEVTGAGFRIARVIRYRNSFRPVIRGAVEPAPGGSRLVATLRLHPAVVVFMLVWLGVALLVTVAMLALLVRGDAGPEALLGLLMLVFGWALATFPFGYEARVAREKLTRLLADAA